MQEFFKSFSLTQKVMV